MTFSIDSGDYLIIYYIVYSLVNHLALWVVRKSSEQFYTRAEGIWFEATDKTGIIIANCKNKTPSIVFLIRGMFDIENLCRRDPLQHQFYDYKICCAMKN